MNSENNADAIALTITFTDADLNVSELEDEVVRLLEELIRRCISMTKRIKVGHSVRL